MKILISSCLLGCNCRYDGNTQKQNELHKLIKNNYVIPFCPEQAGGLSTPRKPCELLNGKVINNIGEDMTNMLLKGANETLKICKLYNIEHAILKSKSPSCGYGLIYDGTFSKTLIEGNGITAKLLSNNGIKIFSELNYTDLLIK
ncbi:DUF523 domain-containing protein [Miniphocaeibacter massiliensis]|uniref:DUF523 domain-containing protein n=1 Tax=Miniphocaeibacter massiliensis TaxID=2041841 RepID=UPI000C1BD24F|nr:DUF523 domain-containing protein [Miniphocaeibacter massiliensis]